jgi:hypothetical protein
MPAQVNDAKVRAFYEQAVNKGDLTAGDNLVAPTEITHYSGDSVGQNTPGSVKKWVTELRAAFPDIRVAVEDLIEKG